MNEDFYPMRLYGKWSKGISLTYLMFADFRDVNQSKNMRDKVAQQVHQKWEDVYYQSKPSLSKHYHLKTSQCRSISAPNTSRRSTLTHDTPSLPGELFLLPLQEKNT